MNPHDFRIWLAMVDKNGEQAAVALGKSTDTIGRYRKKGIPASEAYIVRLAMAAVAAGIKPWSAPNTQKEGT
jgi:hypothetical protein